MPAKISIYLFKPLNLLGYSLYISKFIKSAMRKNILFLFVLLLQIISCSPGEKENETAELLPFVNPLMGTDSDFSLSNGNTYPAIAVPWGMNFWTPQTGEMGDGWAYTYDAKKIRGIKQTHQPSPWINDYAAFSLMAVTGELVFNEDERESWFSHKAEEVHPNYYSVYLADHDLTMEVTASDRAAIFRFTFPRCDSSWILLDAFFKGSKVEIDAEKGMIKGYCRNNSGGVPANFHNYFVATVDRGADHFHTWKDGELKKGSTGSEGDHVGAALGFRTEKGEQLILKVASSFISEEQALLNLEREVGDKGFEQLREESGALWENELAKIRVEGGKEEWLRSFYSSLYRVLLFPRKFYEYDAGGNIVHYSPYNGKVLPGYMFTDNGFWDTFRAVFPLFTLMYPEFNSQLMQGLVNTYKESGWLPEWASPGHRGCMIGSNSASLVADSYLKGIRDYDIELLYEAMLKNTKAVNNDITSVGRLGWQYYNELGYIPYDVGINENVARTLEYAYADYCISRLGEALGRPGEEVELFRERSMNYKNVFDRESNLMRGRNKDGSFQSPFNPLKWGDAFTEGNSLHYTWSVFHDMPGLMELMGGKERFVATLDTVFEMPPDFDCSYYGFPIHEIREMQIVNMGNYAHGNQPIQHMVYLYNWGEQPRKTQEYVREILTRLYTPYPDGYCGDEDNGQTSAWYVFSALGFYPVCPGSNEYIFGSPLFKRAELSFPNGKKLLIEAPDNSPGNPYVNSIELNGREMDTFVIRHKELLEGGKLRFEMSR